MYFLDTLQGLFGSKRKGYGQEESPAKKNKVEQQQTDMPNSHIGHVLEPEALARPRSLVNGLDSAAAAAAKQQRGNTGQQHRQQEQLAYEPRRYEAQQQPQQQQQHEQFKFGQRSQASSQPAYDKVMQILERPRVGISTPRQHAGHAPRQAPQHMPRPTGFNPPQQQGPQGFWKRGSSIDRSDSPPLHRLTPATAHRGRSSGGGMQKGGYGTLGPAPYQQQQQQQQGRSYTAALQVRRPATVTNTSRPGSTAAAAASRGQSHRLLAQAPHQAAAAAEPLRRSESPPVANLAQRWFGEGIADNSHRPPAAAAAAADDGGGVQGVRQALPSSPAAGGTAAAGAATAVFGSNLQTPPAPFNALLRQTVDGGDGLSKEAAAAEAKVKAAQAKLQHCKVQGQHEKHKVNKLIGNIDSVFSLNLSPDYKPNQQDAVAQRAHQDLQEQTFAHDQQRLQQRQQYLLQLEQQALKRKEQLELRSVAAAGVVPALPPGPGWKPKTPAEWQQQQQQEQQQEQEDSEVVIVSGDEEEGDRGDEQPYEAEGSVSEAESAEESEEEAEESEEADEAAAGIAALGIIKWMVAPSDWSLTPEQQERYLDATSGGLKDKNTIVVTHKRSNLELSRYDLSTMKPKEWLNDECINMYMALLQDRDAAERGSSGVTCHYFNTFFLNKLYVDEGEYAYKNVRRWTLPARLKPSGLAVDCVLKCDRVIIPVHQGSHWTALMVDLKGKRLVFFDSLLGENRRVVSNVKRWLEDEAKDKLKVTWDTSDWQEVYPRSIPQQQNGYDCGVFALMFCNRMGTKGGAFDFRQADIQFNIRAAIVCDLLDGKIQATAWRG